MARESDKINLDTLAKMFKLPTQEEIDEANWENVADAGHYAAEEATKEGLSERAIEQAREKAEMAEQDEVFSKYHGAVMSAAEHLFEKHGLGLVPIRKSEKYPFEFRIQPLSGETWATAAGWIIQTINGVGMFEIPREDYAGSKARGFVLSHYGHIRYWPKVYGEASAERIYERAWR